MTGGNETPEEKKKRLDAEAKAATGAKKEEYAKADLSVFMTGGRGVANINDTPVTFTYKTFESEGRKFEVVELWWTKSPDRVPKESTKIGK